MRGCGTAANWAGKTRCREWMVRVGSLVSWWSFCGVWVRSPASYRHGRWSRTARQPGCQDSRRIGEDNQDRQAAAFF